jgi:hypothetical protein
MTWEMKDLISRLITVNPIHRLGSLADGVDGIRNHSWFDDIDFPALRRMEIEAPWKPSLKGKFDASLFTKGKNLQPKLMADYPDLTAREQERFGGF